LKGAGLVKTVGFKNPSYIGDPLNAVKLFNELGADELLILDITASKEGRTPSLKVIQQIADEAFMPFAVGGGIKEIEHIKALLNAGAEKVVLNTASVLNPRLVEEASDIFGAQSIIVSIDAKKRLFGGYKVHIHGGSKATSLKPIEHAKEMARRGAGEILITSMDRDGTMRQPSP
jgi:cyclase